MPGYKTHLFGGVLAYTFLLALPLLCVNDALKLELNILAWLLCCALAGSLFPDIDIKSKGQFLFARIAGLFVISAIVLENWTMLASLSILLLFPLLIHHRGITHQVWFILAAPLSIPLLMTVHCHHLTAPAVWGYLFFVAGALSHLMLDYGLTHFWQRGLFTQSHRYKRRRRRRKRRF